MPILAKELPHSPGTAPSGAGSAACESRQRGRAAGAYRRVPQTLRRPAITYRLSCVMVGMSKRHHLGRVPTGPKKRNEKRNERTPIAALVLASLEIESVTRRVGRGGFSKVYPWNGRIQP